MSAVILVIHLCYPFDFDINDISILKDFEEADILKAEYEWIKFQCDDELRRKAPKKMKMALLVTI